jgi:hypothetical protein
VLLGIAGLLLVGLAVGALLWFREVQTAATAGRDSLKAGFAALEQQDAAAARAGFADAGHRFAALDDLLGPDWLQGAPGVGRDVTAAHQLVALGEAGSTAGGHVADLLAAAEADGGLDALLRQAGPHLTGALDSLQRLSEVDAALSTDGLLPQLAEVVTSARAALDPVRPLLGRLAPVRALVDYFFGADHRFLVLSQNNAELRPTGGFIGSYALLKVGPGGLDLEHYADIYDLPPTTLKIPIPAGARMGGQWLELRDANWWLDFPTSAATILDLYDHLAEPQPAVDGVIGIDMVTIQALLAQFGPIELPEYGTTFRADDLIRNLIVLVQQEVPREGRKDVLVPLAEELLDRLVSVPGDQLAATVELLTEVAGSKRIQLFARDAAAQAAVGELGWSGAIDLPTDATDLLAPSDAVVWASKMNFGVHRKADYQVALAADGSADTRLALRYRKDSDRLLQVQRQWFGNYLRIYRAPGTTLTGSDSTRSATVLTDGQRRAELTPEVRTDQIGLPAITTGLSLNPGETRTEEFESRVPAATTGDADGRHYRLLLVKQPDLEELHATVSVLAPQGWRVEAASAWRRHTGDVLHVTTSGDRVALDTRLEADTILDVALVRA